MAAPTDEAALVDRLDGHGSPLRHEDLERDSAQAYDVEAVRRFALLHQVLAVLENPVLRAAADQGKLGLGHPVEGGRFGEQLLNGLH